jgi:hypothetical protein
VTSVSSVSAQDRVDATKAGANNQCLLVQDAIWQAVSEVARSDTSLALGQQAQSIAKTYPTSGFSRQDIEDALVFAAIDEGVAVDVSPSKSQDDPIIEFRSLWRAAGRKRQRKSGRKRAKPQGADAARQATA